MQLGAYVLFHQLLAFHYTQPSSLGSLGFVGQWCVYVCMCACACVCVRVCALYLSFEGFVSVHTEEEW